MHLPGGPPDSIVLWLAESHISHSPSKVPEQLSKSPSL